MKTTTTTTKTMTTFMIKSTAQMTTTTNKKKNQENLSQKSKKIEKDGYTVIRYPSKIENRRNRPLGISLFSLTFV